MIYADNVYKYKIEKGQDTIFLPKLSRFDKFLCKIKRYKVFKLPENPELKVEKSFSEYKKLTEEEALEKLNHQESITKEEARDILFSLCDAVKERAENLPEHVVSSWEYYKGEFNGMDVGIRLLSKLK